MSERAQALVAGFCMFAVMIGLLVAMGVMGSQSGHRAGVQETLKEAAERGFGGFVADPVTGKTEWKWKGQD